MKETAVKKCETVYEIVQENFFSLSLQQQRIVLYLISMLSPYDVDTKLYEPSVREFCGVCGFNETDDEDYQEVKDILQDIYRKRIWVTLESGQQAFLYWVKKAYIDCDKNLVQIQLDSDMRPYLLQLKQNFTDKGLTDLSARNGKEF